MFPGELQMVLTAVTAEPPLRGVQRTHESMGNLPLTDLLFREISLQVRFFPPLMCSDTITVSCRTPDEPA